MSVDVSVVHDLATTREPVARLHTYHRNPRHGDLAAIRESLRVNGQYRPLVANRGTHTGRRDEVLAGNHTLKAAREEGWSEIAVCWVDVDDDHAARIVAADNRTADLGDYDERLLAELLGDLPDLAGTGYDEDDLDAITRRLSGEVQEGLTDPDEAPSAEDEPLSRLGEVYELGAHRLVVGDACDPAAWEKLLTGLRPADLVWTDPPYGVAYVGKTKDALRITGDDAPTEGLLRAVFGHVAAHTAPGACWYVAAPAGPDFLAFGAVLAELGVWRQTLVWVKDQFVMGRSDYHYRHEAIFYGWTPGAAHHPLPDRTQDSIHEYDRPKASREHPTMKPVGLIERHLLNSTDPGALVLDPFGGSGSTLIAAHRQRRAAALIELDPRYADVICRRYQAFTGELPRRNGEPVDFSLDAETAA